MDKNDDDEENFESLYDNGHWEWDDLMESLVFQSDILPIEQDLAPPTPIVIGAMDFRDDLDLLEQQRFRKRFQRKTSENDVIILQDIKDVVLFTAPKSILTPAIINILHLSSTERFIRALILYCQYYIQVAEEMANRVLELHIKVRTPASHETELQYRENLEDLRLLVAKEYYSIIQGEFLKYHHMGPKKKTKSLSKKEGIMFESLLRICVQIVWLTLGRFSYNQLELEINRLFKSEIYNMVEHRIKSNYHNNLSPMERFTLLGHCVKTNGKMKTQSPLINEVSCERPIDYRLLGLGVINYPSLKYRMRYLEQTLIAPEEMFEEYRITLGILGLTRNRFDIMLREIKPPSSTASSSASFGRSISRISSKASNSARKSIGNYTMLYSPIILPEKDSTIERLPDNFPIEFYPHRHCNIKQRRKWMAHVSRLSKNCLMRNKHTSKSKYK